MMCLVTMIYGLFMAVHDLSYHDCNVRLRHMVAVHIAYIIPFCPPDMSALSQNGLGAIAATSNPPRADRMGLTHAP